MVAPFVDLLDKARAEGKTGPDVDTMADAVAQMRALAPSASDAGDYGAILAKSGLYQTFSDAYNRLASASYTSADGELPSDEQLMANTLAAYRSSLDSLRGVPDEARLRGPIEQVVALGQSGVTYPVFLRQMTEQGLDWAMAGSIVSRDALVSAVDHARSTVDPAREAQHQELLDAYDDLVARSPFGAIDPFEFELVRFGIEWRHAPGIASRDALIGRWRRLLDLVVDWLDAHCSFAPTDDRFQGATRRETQERIEMARECNPGFLAVREALVVETWNLHFDDIFEHESFGAEQRAGRVRYTDARLELARATRSNCVPGGSPPQDLVTRAEELYRSGQWWIPDRPGEGPGDAATATPRPPAAPASVSGAVRRLWRRGR
jgi:hypothetical protein